MTDPMFIPIPGVKDYIFDGHAGAGPSASERWMNCTASLGASREFLETLTPNQQVAFGGANEAARQGTTAHAAAEVEANLLLGRVDQAEADATLMELAIMPDTDGEAYDDEMAEYITEYVDLIKGYADERGAESLLIEARVSATVPLTDPFDEGEVYEIKGSADCVVLPTKDEPTLVVGDLKYGDGIHVDVDENPQIRIYALGVLAMLVDEEGILPSEIEEVVYHIIQPRLGGIKTWRESVDDLLEWRDTELSPALSRALAGVEGGAEYKPSEETCQWCPARGACSALAESRMAEAADLFDTIVEAEYENGPGSFPETSSLSDERLGTLLTQIRGLVKIHDDLKEEAQRRLHRGTPVPGFKLVSYTPPRRWSSSAPEALAEMQVWKPPTLMTPTQALLAAKGNEEALSLIEEQIESPLKRPVVAPEGDRRKDWAGIPPESMFNDETGEG